MAIYISPDGGETVYVQKADGSRGRLVSQTQYAKDIETIQDEQEMVDEYAVKMRRNDPVNFMRCPPLEGKAT